MTDQPELANCPWCNTDSSYLSCEGHYVECEKCGATGPYRYPIPDRDKSINDWNTRPNVLPLDLKSRIIEQIKEHKANFPNYSRVVVASPDTIGAIILTLNWILEFEGDDIDE